MVVYVWLIVGFVLLIKGADFFVDGSSSVAKLLRIPTIIIGLTVVAFGTSLPEASVSITAALQGKNDLAVSNVIGSNIFNLLVVLGASALVQPVKTKWSVIKKEFPFSIVITAVLLLLMWKPIQREAFSGLVSGKGSFILGRFSGLVLLTLFIYYLYSTIRQALEYRREGKLIEPEEDMKPLSPGKSAVFIIAGLIGIVIGGDLVVDSATEIAVRFGMSQTFIGLTIVALGTSLPELVTSMVAAGKGENDLALGNVVGSNIFNILLILGASSAIFPIAVAPTAIYDTIILIAASLVVYFCAVTKRVLKRGEGALFIVIYAAFFVYILLR
ncbi:MAG TPA: sodium:proton exchanger [Lachnospiraceae bacterium]|nr:sodium:proton exchanger [Lachnospiraceae bacterium]